MKLFDQEGAENYAQKIPRHWSFRCKEDLFPRWIGPSCLGFHPIGNQITFDAQDSALYNERISRQQYTYLANIPVISWLIKKIISSASWEAHMPTIYDELAPCQGIV
jgi:hypothetical protein